MAKYQPIFLKEPLPVKDAKRCPKCKHTKKLSEFYSNAKSADGRGVYCKECAKEKSRRVYHRRKEKQEAADIKAGRKPAKTDFAKSEVIEEFPQPVEFSAKPTEKTMLSTKPVDDILRAVDTDTVDPDTSLMATELTKTTSRLELERERVEILLKINALQGKLMDLYREEAAYDQ